MATKYQIFFSPLHCNCMYCILNIYNTGFLKKKVCVVRNKGKIVWRAQLKRPMHFNCQFSKLTSQLIECWTWKWDPSFLVLNRELKNFCDHFLCWLESKMNIYCIYISVLLTADHLLWESVLQDRGQWDTDAQLQASLLSPAANQHPRDRRGCLFDICNDVAISEPIFVALRLQTSLSDWLLLLLS